MFYYLLPTLISPNIILIIAAVIPAVVLMFLVYRSDHLEKESSRMIWILIRNGILSALLALVAEKILSAVLDFLVYDYKLYQILLYFGVVAFSEEGAKYFLLHRTTWNNHEFNCQYDGVVYATFISLGFARWENISYVLHYGLTTALIRAVTAIPGHTCFGVYMGVFYGLARFHTRRGNYGLAKLSKILALIVPAVLHGSYDYIATTAETTWGFVGFIAVLFLFSYFLVRSASKQDRRI